MIEGTVVAVGSPQAFRQQVARALGTAPETVDWMPTVAAVEEMLSSRPVPPTVLVLSPAGKDLDAFGLAEFTLRASPTTVVLLVRDHTPNGILPAAMRAGIRDVIDLSRGGEDLHEALGRAVAWSENVRSLRPETPLESETERGKILSVFSSKGGTGKTFLTTNLAAAIAIESGEDTAVVDLDHDLGDVFAYFGKEPTRPLADILTLGDDPDGDQLRSAATKLEEHLWGFGSPYDPGAKELNGELMGQILRALRRGFRYTIVDATADYSDPALAAFDLSDQIYLISGLDVVGVRHLSVALQTLLSLGFPRDRFRVALNRADSKVGLKPEDVERVMRIKIDAMIPSSRFVPMSLNRGVPIVIEDPKSEVARSIKELARRVAGITAPAKHRRRR
jgi:pilus assembly protein CpaE